MLYSNAGPMALIGGRQGIELEALVLHELAEYLVRRNAAAVPSSLQTLCECEERLDVAAAAHRQDQNLKLRYALRVQNHRTQRVAPLRVLVRHIAQAEELTRDLRSEDSRDKKEKNHFLGF